MNPDDLSEVVGIIDWQASEIAPLFNQAGEPKCLHYVGEQLEGLERPEPPKGLKGLDSGEKAEIHELYVNQSLSVYHRKLLYYTSPPIYNAMEFQKSSAYELLMCARNLSIDGEAYFMSQLVHLKDNWKELPVTGASNGTPLPFDVSEDETKQIKTDLEAAEKSLSLMNEVKEVMGDLFPDNCHVPESQHEKTKNAFLQMKAQVMAIIAKTEEDRLAWEEEWPFDN